MTPSLRRAWYRLANRPSLTSAERSSDRKDTALSHRTFDSSTNAPVYSLIHPCSGPGLAWHIARLPGGRVALALQYGHLRASMVTDGYAGRARDGLRRILDIETPMFVVDDPETGQARLFHTHKGKRLTKADRRPGCTPFVTGTRMNNSIKDYASVAPIFPARWVTLIYNGDGGTGHAKYQPAPFNASDDVIVLEPLSLDATEDALLVLVTILTRQCVSKFNFGYKLTLDRLLRQRIMVPVTLDKKGGQAVDWAGMAAYGRALRVRAERALDRDREIVAS